MKSALWSFCRLSIILLCCKQYSRVCKIVLIVSLWCLQRGLIQRPPQQRERQPWFNSQKPQVWDSIMSNEFSNHTQYLISSQILPSRRSKLNKDSQQRWHDSQTKTHTTQNIVFEYINNIITASNIIATEYTTIDLLGTKFSLVQFHYQWNEV